MQGNQHAHCEGRRDRGHRSEIAGSKEKISAPVHSPVSGKVVKIATSTTLLRRMLRSHFHRKRRQENQRQSLQPIFEAELEKTPNDVLLKIIREAGIMA